MREWYGSEGRGLQTARLAKRLTRRQRYKKTDYEIERY